MAETVAASAAAAAAASASHLLRRDSSPAAAPASSKPAPRPQHLPSKPSTESTTRATANTSTPLTKRKQSKSRNGCLTCKAKRLKCDETKPTCQQCARRSVTCGGYKKDFKWRPFEEASFTTKPTAKTRKGWSSPPSQHQHQHQPHDIFLTNLATNPTAASPPPPNDSPVTSNVSHQAFVNPLQHAFYPQSQAPPPFGHGLTPLQSINDPFPLVSGMFQIPQPSPFLHPPPPVSPVDSYAAPSVEGSSIFESESVHTRLTKTTAPSSVSSGQSPRLVDLLLPGTDLSIPPEEYTLFRSQHEAIYQPTGLTPPADTMDLDDENGVEEIPRIFPSDQDAWIMRPPSPSPSSSSSSSSDSQDFRLLAQPQMSSTSPEMLTRRFDRDTCGILSVKDGPTENPWRTLVWPLARDCPALYHAIASLTSFHQSKDSPAMRIQGIDHMRAAFHALASSLENMHVDAAISTTLVLAFSESWDQHISTGINHIKGAKILLNKALVQRSQAPVVGEEFNRLKFLCNTWIYMDVIARLTSAENDESDDFDVVYDSIYANGETDTKLDPLMGCATTLFPIIGRVANLVRKVRRTNGNGPTIISKAMQLKSQLEDWTPPSFIEDPEDQSTSPHDSIKTAAAYQYATLLYLHQAVPEIPSLPSADLAKKVLCDLATVDISSRSTIVHIYPLMAAGCEAMEQEDRDWVCIRWGLMSSRMKLGIIEKCLEVTKEVWTRRDAYVENLLLENQQISRMHSPTVLKRDFGSFSFEDAGAIGDFSLINSGPKRRAVNRSSFDDHLPIPILAERIESNGKAEPGTEILQHDFTVKGRLHWLGVMKDWNWEVLLG